jgi:hypothetical protein
MRTATSALALSGFVSFFVWISALSIADHRVPGWYGPQDPSFAWAPPG